jgi:SHS2 domain-containing protein
MASPPRHWFEAHTGEVELHLFAPTLLQLFVEAGLGLAELMAGERRRAPTGSAEGVEIQAPDRDALLVDWLNELIFRSETRRKIYDELRITGISDRGLRAEIRGAPPEHLRTAVKAATLHRVHIEEQADGFSAAVVLDV